MTTMRKDDAAEAWRDDPRSAIAALIDRANAEAALGRDDAALADYGRALALLPDPEKGAGTPRSGPPRWPTAGTFTWRAAASPRR